MIALDTNVLVRALVDDPGQAAQCAAVRKRLLLAKQAYVPQVVQAELVWVLETVYDLERSAIVAVLEHLRDNGAFELQHEDSFIAALRDYRTGGADFADYLILAEARARKLPLVSFDRKLNRSVGVERV